MANRKFFVSGVLCLAVLATVLQAATGPTVFVLPNGLGGTNDIATVYGADPFQTVTSVHANPAANLVLETPSGSKYYVIANSGSNTVSSFDASLSSGTPLKQLSLLNQATAAVMSVTPTWVRLLVLTSDGFLHVIDTATDTEIAKVSVGAGPVDVAVSQDGLRAFVLVTGQLEAVDLASNAVLGTTVPVGGTITGVAVAPNGLVYASATNQVLEVDGRSMTLRGTIPLNAVPGKLAFTPDGTSALVVNQTPVTGSSAILINLASRTVTNFVPNFGPTLSKVVVTSNSLAFATSKTNPVIYQLPIPSLTISALTAPAAVTDITASNEYPAGTAAGAKFLFAATSSNTVYRIDPPTGALTGPQVSTNAAGALSYATPGVTGTPAYIIPYNATQVVAPGGLSLPLVVRVLDANGKPLYGSPVTFTTSTTGTVIQTPSTSTNQDGIALTSVTAPGTAGTVTVFGVAGGVTATFTLTVGGTPGGGGTTGGAQIQIVSGNGQVTSSANGNVSALPLTVLVTDVSGNPLPNQTVTWAVTSGQATIVAANSVSTTDTNGLASTNVIGSPFVNPLTRYAQATINASVSTNSVNFTFTTLANNPGGAPGGIFTQITKPPQTNRSLTGSAGQTLPAAIQVLVADVTGNPIPNVGITASTGLDPKVGPTASCKGVAGTAFTDTTGTVNCDLVLGNKIGTAQLTVTIGGILTSFPITLTVTPGAPSQVVILQGNNQSGNPGQALPLALKAQITDAGGNPLPGVQVKWVVASGTATLSNVITTSDANGNVSALATLGATFGPIQVTVTTVTGNASGTFNLTVNTVLGGLQAASGGNQTATTGQAFAQPLVAVVTDTKGNAAAGVAVSFAVTSGSASLSAATATTDAQGRATVSVTAGSTAGAVTVTASISGTSFSATFSLTVIPPGPSITAAGFLNGAGFMQGVVPGEVLYIGGSGIAPGINGSVVGNSIFGPLPTTLAGDQVLFGSTAAPIYSVNNINGQESIVVQVPFEIPVGSTPVTVQVGGGSSTVTVQVLPYMPGIFETTVGGKRYGVVLRPDGSFASPTNPAKRGETVQMYVTGLGLVLPPAGTNKAGVGGQNVLAQVVVGINNAGVTPISAVYAPDMIGVYIVTFQIPSDTATGSAQPLAIALGPYGSLVFGNGSLIAIQ